MCSFLLSPPLIYPEVGFTFELCEASAIFFVDNPLAYSLNDCYNSSENETSDPHGAAKASCGGFLFGLGRTEKHNFVGKIFTP